MKSSQKNKKTSHDDASINMPAQKIWKKLEEYKVKTNFNKNSRLDCKKVKKIGRLLDRAFELLLEKLIRQN